LEPIPADAPLENVSVVRHAKRASDDILDEAHDIRSHILGKFLLRRCVVAGVVAPVHDLPSAGCVVHFHPPLRHQFWNQNGQRHFGTNDTQRYVSRRLGQGDGTLIDKPAEVRNQMFVHGYSCASSRDSSKIDRLESGTQPV
jgi:hypothetical protein